MKSYSPVDNVRAQRYPHILAIAGLHDPRVRLGQREGGTGEDRACVGVGVGCEWVGGWVGAAWGKCGRVRAGWRRGQVRRLV